MRGRGAAGRGPSADAVGAGSRQTRPREGELGRSLAFGVLGVAVCCAAHRLSGASGVGAWAPALGRLGAKRVGGGGNCWSPRPIASRAAGGVLGGRVRIRVLGRRALGQPSISLDATEIWARSAQIEPDCRREEVSTWAALRGAARGSWDREIRGEPQSFPPSKAHPGEESCSEGGKVEEDREHGWVSDRPSLTPRPRRYPPATAYLRALHCPSPAR